jgi:hypothetical protein
MKRLNQSYVATGSPFGCRGSSPIRHGRFRVSASVPAIHGHCVCRWLSLAWSFGWSVIIRRQMLGKATKVLSLYPFAGIDPEIFACLQELRSS